MHPNQLPEIIHNTGTGHFIDGLAFLGGASIPDKRGTFKPAFRHLRDGPWMNRTAWQEQHPTVSEINISKSHRGVLRGLHTMKGHPQGKVITCAMGSIIDLIVDIRPKSLTFLKSMAIRITENTVGIYIPEGCAHGFYAEHDSVAVYGTSSPYVEDMDAGVNWADDAFGFKKLINPSIISDKDQRLPMLKDFMHSSNVYYLNQ